LCSNALLLQTKAGEEERVKLNVTYIDQNNDNSVLTTRIVEVNWDLEENVANLESLEDKIEKEKDLLQDLEGYSCESVEVIPDVEPEKWGEPQNLNDLLGEIVRLDHGDDIVLHVKVTVKRSLLKKRLQCLRSFGCSTAPSDSDDNIHLHLVLDDLAKMVDDLVYESDDESDSDSTITIYVQMRIHNPGYRHALQSMITGKKSWDHQDDEWDQKPNMLNGAIIDAQYRSNVTREELKRDLNEGLELQANSHLRVSYLQRSEHIPNSLIGKMKAGDIFYRALLGDVDR